MQVVVLQGLRSSVCHDGSAPVTCAQGMMRHVLLRLCGARMTVGVGGLVDYRGGFSLPADKSLGDTSDIISDSSGVGTSNSDTTTQGSVSISSMTVVCLENYSSGLPGHLRVTQGDILEGKQSASLFYFNVVHPVVL